MAIELRSRFATQFRLFPPPCPPPRTLALTVVLAAGEGSRRAEMLNRHDPLSFRACPFGGPLPGLRAQAALRYVLSARWAWVCPSLSRLRCASAFAMNFRPVGPGNWWPSLSRPTLRFGLRYELSAGWGF